MMNHGLLTYRMCSLQSGKTNCIVGNVAQLLCIGAIMQENNPEKILQIPCLYNTHEHDCI